MVTNTIKYNHPNLGILEFAYDTSTYTIQVSISELDATPITSFNITAKQAQAIRQGLLAVTDVFSFS